MVSGENEMDRATYKRFTDELIAWAVHDPRVIGLVALGSMADTGRTYDEWSDHDFWVITRNGDAQQIRSDPAWLPEADRIVVHFEESQHGRSAIYAEGHLVEFAVFDDAEVEIADANLYQVLFDDCDLAGRMAAIAERTASKAKRDPTGGTRLGTFLSQLVIGANRYGRGENLSANDMIRGRATRALVSLLADFAQPEAEADLDNLDPHRRFETAFPSLGAEMSTAMERSPPEAAAALLAIARRELVGKVANATPQAMDAVGAVIARASG